MQFERGWQLHFQGKNVKPIQSARPGQRALTESEELSDAKRPQERPYSQASASTQAPNTARATPSFGETPSPTRTPTPSRPTGAYGNARAARFGGGSGCVHVNGPGSAVSGTVKRPGTAREPPSRPNTTPPGEFAGRFYGAGSSNRQDSPYFPVQIGAWPLDRTGTGSGTAPQRPCTAPPKTSIIGQAFPPSPVVPPSARPRVAPQKPAAPISRRPASAAVASGGWGSAAPSSQPRMLNDRDVDRDVEHHSALEVLTGRLSKGWQPEVYLQARLEILQSGSIDGLKPLLQAVRTCTEKAISHKSYKVLSYSQDDVHVDLHLLMQGHPRLQYFGRSNIKTNLNWEHNLMLAPATVCIDSPADIARNLAQSNPVPNPIVLVIEINAFDEAGNIDYRIPGAVLPDDMLLRSDLARFLEEANAECARSHGGKHLSLRNHMCDVHDPLLLKFFQVALFRGSQEEGYPFLQEPVQVTVIAFALSHKKPNVQRIRHRTKTELLADIEWYEHNRDHSAMLKRLELLGELGRQHGSACDKIHAQEEVVIIEEHEKPIIVMCIPGSGNSHRQPRDAVANCLKHWIRQFGSSFSKVFFCCLGRGSGDSELAAFIGPIINRRPGAMRKPKPQRRRSSDRGLYQDDIEENYLALHHDSELPGTVDPLAVGRYAAAAQVLTVKAVAMRTEDQLLALAEEAPSSGHSTPPPERRPDARSTNKRSSTDIRAFMAARVVETKVKRLAAQEVEALSRASIAQRNIADWEPEVEANKHSEPFAKAPAESSPLEKDRVHGRQRGATDVPAGFFSPEPMTRHRSCEIDDRGKFRSYPDWEDEETVTQAKVEELRALAPDIIYSKIQREVAGRYDDLARRQPREKTVLRSILGTVDFDLQSRGSRDVVPLQTVEHWNMRAELRHQLQTPRGFDADAQPRRASLLAQIPIELLSPSRRASFLCKEQNGQANDDSNVSTFGPVFRLLEEAGLETGREAHHLAGTGALGKTPDRCQHEAAAELHRRCRPENKETPQEAQTALPTLPGCHLSANVSAKRPYPSSRRSIVKPAEGLHERNSFMKKATRESEMVEYKRSQCMSYDEGLYQKKMAIVAENFEENLVALAANIGEKLERRRSMPKRRDAAVET